jgi:hypothetical protein
MGVEDPVRSQQTPKYGTWPVRALYLTCRRLMSMLLQAIGVDERWDTLEVWSICIRVLLLFCRI